MPCWKSSAVRQTSNPRQPEGWNDLEILSSSRDDSIVGRAGVAGVGVRGDHTDNPSNSEGLPFSNQSSNLFNHEFDEHEFLSNRSVDSNPSASFNIPEDESSHLLVYWRFSEESEKRNVELRLPSPRGPCQSRTESQTAYPFQSRTEYPPESPTPSDVGGVGITTQTTKIDGPCGILENENPENQEDKNQEKKNLHPSTAIPDSSTVATVSFLSNIAKTKNLARNAPSTLSWISIDSSNVVTPFGLHQFLNLLDRVWLAPHPSVPVEPEDMWGETGLPSGSLIVGKSEIVCHHNFGQNFSKNFSKGLSPNGDLSLASANSVKEQTRQVNKTDIRRIGGSRTSSAISRQTSGNADAAARKQHDLHASNRAGHASIHASSEPRIVEAAIEVNTWGVLALPGRGRGRPFSVEMWFKFHKPSQQLFNPQSPWILCRIGFSSFGGSPFTVALTAKFEAGGLVFRLRRVVGDLVLRDFDTSDLNTVDLKTGEVKTFETKAVDLNAADEGKIEGKKDLVCVFDALDCQFGAARPSNDSNSSNSNNLKKVGVGEALLSTEWMFVSLVVPETGPPVLHLFDGTWRRTQLGQKSVKIEDVLGTDRTTLMGWFGVGSKISDPFEVTEVRLFDSSRETETVQTEAFRLLPDAVQSRVNLIKQIRINPAENQTNQNETIPRIPTTEQEAFQHEEEIDQIHQKKKSLISPEDRENNSKENNSKEDNSKFRNSKFASTRSGLKQSGNESKQLSLCPSRSLDTLDIQTTDQTDVSNPNSVVPNSSGGLLAVAEDNANSHPESAGADRSAEQSFEEVQSKAGDKHDTSTDSEVPQLKQIDVLQNRAPKVPKSKEFRAACKKRMESLYASRFLCEVGREMLLNATESPIPLSPYGDSADAFVFLLTINLQLVKMENAVLSCKFLKALQIRRFCLGALTALLQNGVTIEQLQYPERILPSEEYFSLPSKIELRKFNPTFLSQLTRSTRYHCTSLPNAWRRFPHLADVLQAHIAAVSRVVLCIRLLLAALWILCDIESLLNSSSEIRNEQRFNTFSYPLGVRCIWTGEHWASLTNLAALGGRELSEDEKIALEYLWIDFVAIMALIWSVGLPFGLPARFSLSLFNALEELGQRPKIGTSPRPRGPVRSPNDPQTHCILRSASRLREEEENSFEEEEEYCELPMPMCFISGSRLDDDCVQCPICSALFSSLELPDRLTSGNLRERRCPYCGSGVVCTQSNACPTTVITTSSATRPHHTAR